MWVSLERPVESRRRARWGSSLLLSLVVHGVIATLLGLSIATPEVRETTLEFVVTVERWLPPPRPVSSEKKPIVVSEPSSSSELLPPKPTVFATTFTRISADIEKREERAPTIFPRFSDGQALGFESLENKPIERAPRGVPGGELPPTFSALVHGVPVGKEVVPVKLPEGSLSGDSPQVGREPTLSASRRGLGAENAPRGGFGGDERTGGRHTAYRSLMETLARGVLATTSSPELDVVFVVDATESMVDNVRGVQAYVDEFVGTLLRDRRDVRFGLVTFSDVVNESPKVQGMTDDVREVRNWFSRVRFEGGGELIESGLDAVVKAMEELTFRKRAQVYFLFISDAPFHDRDFDGQSRYTLDEVIATLKSRRILLDAVGIDYLPVKQLAWGTGGRWLAIPGSGYLEDFLPPLPVRSNAALGVLTLKGNAGEDEVLVFCRGSRRPSWIELRWRVLNPRGERVGKEVVERQTLPPDADRITFRPTFDVLSFRGNPGYYTVIYRIGDSLGNSSVLRRVMEYR